MKSKTFIILVVLLCVLSGLAYVVLKQDRPAEQDKMGALLFEDFSANDIASVVITSPAGDSTEEVVLKKGESVWKVENRFDYPADFGQLSDLVRKIKDVKVGRRFPVTEENRSRLGLLLPDASGTQEDRRATRIMMKNQDDQLIADILVGKAREGSSAAGGHYLMLADSGDVNLVDQSFRFVKKSPADWLDKKLLSVPSKDIRRVECLDPENPDRVYMVGRSEQGAPPELMVVPDGRTVETSKLDSLFNALSSFRMADVAGPSKSVENAAFETSKYLVFRLFDGTEYKIFPGGGVPGESDKHYLKLEASFTAPSQPKTAEEKPDESEIPEDTAEKKKDAEAIAQQVAEINDSLSEWVFIVSNWTYKNFVTDPEQFLAEKKEDSPA